MPATPNDTYKDGTTDPAAHVRFPIMVSAYIPAFLISEIGNALVIYSLAYLKRRQRTFIDNYILNLALADILITTLTLFNAIEYKNNEWELGEVFCKIHGQMLEICYTVSVLTLLAISYNRGKVVADAFKILNARKTLKRSIVLIWLAAFVLTSPLLYAYTVAKRNNRFHCSNTNFPGMSRKIYYLLQAVILFFIPILVMTASHRKITKGLRQHSEIYGEAMDDRNSHWKRVMTHERRISKFLTWIWVVFIFCFTPHILLRTADHFASMRTNEIWNQVWHVSQYLALLNSAINPFLYYRATNRDNLNVSRIIKLFCCIRPANNQDVARQSRASSHRALIMNTTRPQK